MKQEQKINEIEVNGIKYIPKDQANEPSTDLDGMKCVLVRTYSAGVHFGYLEKKEGKEVMLRKTRRVYYWSGAASLSQMAIDGVKNPDDCGHKCSQVEFAKLFCNGAWLLSIYPLIDI